MRRAASRGSSRAATQSCGESIAASSSLRATIEARLREDEVEARDPAERGPRARRSGGPERRPSPRDADDDFPARHGGESIRAAGVRRPSRRPSTSWSTALFFPPGRRLAAVSEFRSRSARPRDSFLGAVAVASRDHRSRATPLVRSSCALDVRARHGSRHVAPPKRRRCRWRTPDRESSMRTEESRTDSTVSSEPLRSPLDAKEFRMTSRHLPRTRVRAPSPGRRRRLSLAAGLLLASSSLGADTTGRAGRRRPARSTSTGLRRRDRVSAAHRRRKSPSASSSTARRTARSPGPRTSWRSRESAKSSS